MMACFLRSVYFFAAEYVHLLQNPLRVSIILTLELSIHLMESFPVTHASNTTGSAELCGPSGRAEPPAEFFLALCLGSPSCHLAHGLGAALPGLHMWPPDPPIRCCAFFFMVGGER